MVVHGARLTVIKDRLEAIGGTWSLFNTPNLIGFQHVIGVRALVKFSAILLDHILQKRGNEGTLFWATGSHEIMVFAIADEVKQELIKSRALKV